MNELSAEAADSILSRDPSSILSHAPSAIMQHDSLAVTPHANTTGGAGGYPKLNLRGRNFAEIPVHTVRQPMVQPKLAVGPADDKSEQEANRAEQQVMSMPSRPLSIATPGEEASGKAAPVRSHTLELPALQRQPIAAAISVAGSTNTIQRVPYTDIPDLATWKTDSKVKRTKRSAAFRNIDNKVEQWEALKDSDDKNAQILHLYATLTAIRDRQRKKDDKYLGDGGTSVRQSFADDLKTIVEQKLAEIQTSFKVDLAPLALEYTQAAEAHNMTLTRTKGTQLARAYAPFYYEVAGAGLTSAKTTDMLTWACTSTTRSAPVQNLCCRLGSEDERKNSRSGSRYRPSPRYIGKAATRATPPIRCARSAKIIKR